MVFVLMIAENYALTTLQLSCNHIGNKGVQYLADALKHHTVLNIS
jgi:hypothetical protein